MSQTTGRQTMADLVSQLMPLGRPERLVGFADFKRDRDPELSQQDLFLLQLYAGLGVLARDLDLYLPVEAETAAGETFRRLVGPVIDGNRRNFPESTIFGHEPPSALPTGYAVRAAAGRPTVQGLEGAEIVHEYTTKPGKEVFYAFFRAGRDSFCGPDGPYARLRSGKVSDEELGVRIASVFYDDVLSSDLCMAPLAAYLGVCAVKKEFAELCDLTTILFLSADPTDLSRILQSRELREIREQIVRARYRNLFDLVDRTAVRASDLNRAFLDAKPQIVHFSGHGTGDGLCLEDAAGLMRPLPPEALAARFRLMRDHLRCVVINACFSVEQAAILAEHVDTVIAMEGDISDPAAVAFSMGFYGALGAAGSEADFDEAFDLACAEMQLQGVANVERPFIMTEKGMRHCL